MTSLHFAVKDRACTGPNGTYYTRYLWQENPHEPYSALVHLGKIALTAEQALDLADKELAERGPGMFSQGSVYRAAAASVLRLCMRHEEPVLEVVENAVVVPENAEKITIEGSPYSHMHDSEYSLPTRSARMRDDREHWRTFGDSGPAHFTYLPHEDYSASDSEHAGVFAHGGDAGFRVNIGLLGDETIFQAEPDTPQETVNRNQAMVQPYLD